MSNVIQLRPEPTLDEIFDELNADGELDGLMELYRKRPTEELKARGRADQAVKNRAKFKAIR